MKLVSWNVNGIRAIQKKGFRNYFESEEPDIFCLQETKARPEQVDLAWMEGYHALWNPAEKPGYSGTAIFCRRKPSEVRYGMGIDEHDREGRVITARFRGFYLVNVYTPNAQNELRRLDYRQRWDRDFLNYLRALEEVKPVIFCGDLNVAHQEIDLARPKQNRNSAGFTDQERAGFSKYLDAGFIDTFREFEKGGGHYSWWSFRGGARERNVGWRIDYWCISRSLRRRLKSAYIQPEVTGSDHCPVVVELR